MRSRPMLVVAALLLCGTALAACKDSGVAQPETTVPTAAATPAPSTTSSTVAAAPDVTVIPATIDEAYVNAVLAALDEIDGRASRLIASTKRLPEEAVSLLQAIFGDEEFLHQAGNWAESLRLDPALSGVLPDPGNRVTKVERIIEASPTCIWLAVQRDRSKVNVDPGPDRTEYVALEPVDRSNDPAGLNPTPWAITMDRLSVDATDMADLCAGR